MQKLGTGLVYADLQSFTHLVAECYNLANRISLLKCVRLV